MFGGIGVQVLVLQYSTDKQKLASTTVPTWGSIAIPWEPNLFVNTQQSCRTTSKISADVLGDESVNYDGNGSFVIIVLP